jgi:carbon-monoxide dehydrogenase medium subunit
MKRRRAITNLTVDYLTGLPQFDIFTPITINEACSLLFKYKDQAKVFAGGTDLLISMKQKKANPKYLVNIKNIPGLDRIQNSEKDLKIGAMATLDSVSKDNFIRERFSLLSTACNRIGTPQVRNMGTIGGNICNAGPSQDTIPALLVLEAKLKLVSSQSERRVPISEFFIGPFETVLGQTELLTEIEIPGPPQGSLGTFQWITKLTETDETLVGVAVIMIIDETTSRCIDIRIGLCSVAPIPMRARRAEAALRGQRIESNAIEQCAQIAAEEISPRSRADYRRKMTSVLVKRSINDILHSTKIVQGGRL